MASWSDSFAGTAGTELSAYSASWSKITGATDNLTITSGGRLAYQGGAASTSNGGIYAHSQAPDTANYAVEADIYIASQPSGGNLIAGVCGRIQAGAATYYHAQFIRNVGSSIQQWRLWKCVSGTFAQLGTGVTEALTNGTTHHIKLEMTNSVISLYKNGETTPAISVVDAQITGAGKAGVRIVEAAGAGGDAVGLQLDNFAAADTGYPVMTSAYVCAIRADTGATVFATQKDTTRSMGSTTKVMAAYVACQHAATTDTATMPADMVTGTYPNSSGETNAGLVSGEQVGLDDCLACIFHPSGGDACRMVGGFVGGTYLGGADTDTGGLSTFITEMNTQATTLSMTNTAFVNVTGNLSEGGATSANHYSTVYDLCLLMKAYMEHSGAMFDAGRAWFLLGGSYITTSVTSHHYDQVSSHFGISDWPGITSTKGGSVSGNVSTVGCATRGTTTVYFSLMSGRGDPREADVRALLDYVFTQLGATSDSATATVQDGCDLISLEAGWTRTTYSATNYSENFADTTSTTNAGASVTLTGTSFSVYMPKGSNRGIAEIFFDGVSQGTVDLYNSTWQTAASIGPIWTTSPGTRGSHTIRVACTGTKNAASSSVAIDLDYFTYTDQLAGVAGAAKMAPEWIALAPLGNLGSGMGLQ